MFAKPSLFVLSISAVLTACGGGGGGGADSGPEEASTMTFNVKSAYINELISSSKNNFGVSGKINGFDVTGTGSITSGGLSQDVFENKSALAQTSVISMTLMGNGQTIPVNTSTTAYYDSNYNYLGSLTDEYTVATSITNLPTAAKINDTGVVYTANIYPTRAKSYVSGTETTVYSLGSDTNTTAILTLTTTKRDSSGASIALQSERLRLTTTGTVQRLDATYTSPSQIIKINFN